MNIFTIILFLLGLFVIFLIILFLLSIFKYINNQIKEDDDGEFPSAGSKINPNSWFSSFDRFKKTVYNLAEKDEEIKKYLDSRKDRHNSINADIRNSGRDRKDDGKDVSSDL